MNARTERDEIRLLEASDIKVIRFKAGFEKRYPIVEEVSNKLMNVIQPTFIARATCKIPPLPLGASIQVGWIQVMPKGVAIINHGEQILSMETPEIVKGEELQVGDSDGNVIPWYSERAVKFVEGPTTVPTIAKLTLSDSPSICVPMASYEINGISTPDLNFVYRKERFYTYLALKNLNDENYHIIKALTWYCEVAVGVNSNKPLGKRVEFIGPCDSQDVLIMPDWLIPPLEKFVHNGPTANNSQIFIKREKGKKSSIVMEPTETTVNLKNYVEETEDYTDELTPITLKNFLKKYL